MPLNFHKLNSRPLCKNRQRLYDIVFASDTPEGRRFDIAIISLIVMAFIVMIIDSTTHVDSFWRDIFLGLEILFTLLFTIEYIVRVYASPKPFAYMRSFYGIIDLMAFLPAILVFFFPDAAYFAVLKLLRLMRIFRILKLVRYLQDSNILLRSLLKARRKIFIFFSNMAVLVTIFGTLIFIIEGPENGFTSLPESIYWAIVTITTVGYGDIVPHTPLGRLVAALTMLLGYCILAVPTGIISAELREEMEHRRTHVRCDNCSKGGHEEDAEYCRYCGSDLPELELEPEKEQHR
ncbi:ion transporter [Vibrio sp.]|nr:ion transporter [Vibrio sp.]